MQQPPPWEGRDTPLARAFSRALDRVNSATNAQPGDAATITNSRSTYPLMFSGLDVDTPELAEYLTHTATSYVEAIERRGALIVNDADLAGEGIDTYAPKLKANALLLLRGMAGTVALAGALYGNEHGRNEHATGPMPAAPAPSDRPTVAERHELARDSVQTVLDMEADRLDRTAGALYALGLLDVARSLADVATNLRHELAGGSDPIPPVLARHQARRRAELDREQRSQLERFRRYRPATRIGYLAELEELEQRQAQERQAPEDD